MTTTVVENANETAATAGELLDDIDLNLDGDKDPGGAEADGEPIDAEFSIVADEAAGESAADEIAALKAEIEKLRDELAVKSDLEKQIQKASQRVERLASQVESAESAVEEAKGDLKSARERYETGMRELRSMLKDKGRGQQRLPLQGKENGAAETKGPGGETTAVNGETGAAVGETPAAGVDEHADSPISVLSQKQMVKLAGQDAWEAAKNREEPFGLGKAELEILETAEIATIGDLEKRMREDAWWHQKLPKFGEKKVAKLIESLRVWRGKFPMPVVDVK